ncbi:MULTISPECIES: hypothetical protein [Bacillaceae]|uniref:hypothetical protein n=1 Tax=Bacillaceae TaxID=186817 RepID=UPI001C56925C|nr:hypothetical protein [Rossellomorea sp. YZS02]MBW3111842.1 hypothetical protein [Bacillus sp. MCCB 382]MDX8342020.1 hypothetical protein [Rossellomorea sp. YZS02]
MIYLFSLLALILLLPILYFVPIGISKQGKLILAGISFGLTLLGIVASSQYPMWAIAIMLMALLGVASYMIDQRFSGMMVAAAGSEVEVYEEQKYEVYQPQTAHPDIHSEEVLENTPDNDILPVEEVPEQIESIIDQEEILEIEEDEPPIDEIELIHSPVEEMSESERDTDIIPVPEDESEWFIENTNEMTGKVEVIENQNEIFNDGDLSEIESMIDDTNLQDEPEVEEEEAGLFEEDIPEVGDESVTEEELSDEKGDSEREEVNEQTESTLEIVETDINTALKEEDTYIDELPNRHRIMREVMKTMIEQISLSRSLLTTDQMENMIKHYLHPSLHDQDYYTFARILMDHYISTEQYVDLCMFIKGIEDRFMEYPYILLDIEQTKEFALEKQTK